jgi:hypothetical protein
LSSSGGSFKLVCSDGNLQSDECYVTVIVNGDAPIVPTITASLMLSKNTLNINDINDSVIATVTYYNTNSIPTSCDFMGKENLDVSQSDA